MEELIAKIGSPFHDTPFLEITEGNEYQIYKDNYGEYIFDDLSDRHYLNNFNWQSIFTKKAKLFTFETALKFLQEGFKVRWYSSDGADSVVFLPKEYSNEEATSDFSWKELCEGKWELVTD